MGNHAAPNVAINLKRQGKLLLKMASPSNLSKKNVLKTLQLKSLQNSIEIFKSKIPSHLLIEFRRIRPSLNLIHQMQTKQLSLEMGKRI
jgi:hypothetical protein